ncbi:MAG: plasmid pRiA4b ORF-3 family protein [Bacteroidales bacterium]|nr:plasmid pRiA4b ORF-3 family protein [Bacteroidales bacterium]
MFAYRFKMNFEEQDGFSRDIELGVDQTFLDFYNIITDNLSLDKTAPSSFYLSDHRFRKKKEIIQPGQEDDTNVPAAENFDEETTMKERKLQMDKCPLNEFIDDPHQRFLFIYDLSKGWTFYIELSKIVSKDKGADYPRVVNSEGGVPVEISRKPRPLPGIDDEDELDFDEETEMTSDDQEITLDSEETYGEEDMEEFDDSSFYNEAIDESQDFDEDKL